MSIDLQQAQHIADKIINLRNAVDWSQSDLSRSCNVTRSAISFIEKGIRFPSLPVLIKISQAFKVHLSYFIEESSQVNFTTEAEKFFIRFGMLATLKEEDQKMIQSHIERLKENE